MRELTQLSKAFKELSENGEIYIDDTPAQRHADRRQCSPNQAAAENRIADGRLYSARRLGRYSR